MAARRHAERDYVRANSDIEIDASSVIARRGASDSGAVRCGNCSDFDPEKRSFVASEKSELILIRQRNQRACHAEGRGFESRRSRQVFQGVRFFPPWAVTLSRPTL